MPEWFAVIQHPIEHAVGIYIGLLLPACQVGGAAQAEH